MNNTVKYTSVISSICNRFVESLQMEPVTFVHSCVTITQRILAQIRNAGRGKYLRKYNNIVSFVKLTGITPEEALLFLCPAVLTAIWEKHLSYAVQWNALPSNAWLLSSPKTLNLLY